jgi:site-specific recombinase XerD
VQRVVAEIGNQAGLQVHPHMLRHTFIYNVYKQCGSLTEAQLLARHSRIDQTARYAMPHKEDLERAVENL